MVATGVLGHVAQVAGPGQALQHLDGGHDVVVDDAALGARQRARADAQVLHLVVGQKILHPALGVAPAVRAAYGLHARLVLGPHGLAAQVAAAQECAFLVQLLPLVLKPILQARLGGGVHLRAQGELAAQHVDLGIALEYLKARIDQPDAVENGLQLGRLVHHMHRRGDLAAIVQQAGHLQLVAVALGHDKGGQRPVGGGMRRLGQHHGQCGHALAVAAGVGRLFVDGQVDEVHEGLEQALQLRDQEPIAQRDRRLRGQRLGQAAVLLRKSAHGARGRVYGIDQLQHADQLTVVVAQRHGEKGARAVARAQVKGPGAGKVELGTVIGIGNAHGMVVHGRMHGHQ